MMTRHTGILFATMLLAAAVVTALAAPGDLDPTFGIGGRVTTDMTYWDEASSLVQQADGKLVVAGRSWIGTAYNAYAFALARYDADGSLDGTFGTDGKVRTYSVGDEYDVATALLQQSDGKLVVAGFVGTGQTFNIALVRYENESGPAASSKTSTTTASEETSLVIRIGTSCFRRTATRKIDA